MNPRQFSPTAHQTDSAIQERPPKDSPNAIAAHTLAFGQSLERAYLIG